LEVAVGESFQVDVWVEAGPNNPVDTVQVYLNFDPTKLQVTDVFGGGELEEELQEPEYDNLLGHIKYAVGTLDTNNPLTEEFILLTVYFEALDPTGSGGTPVQFAPLVDPRQTKAIRSGNNRTGTLTNVAVVVNP
jgi:hypothetical protein